jgi:hypothetical protein
LCFFSSLLISYSGVRIWLPQILPPVSVDVINKGTRRVRNETKVEVHVIVAAGIVSFIRIPQSVSQGIKLPGGDLVVHAGIYFCLVASKI